MNNDSETIDLPWENKAEETASSSSPSPLSQDELDELLKEIRFQ